MSEEKKIQTFTATDIERYHKGQLSLQERNALEKAALDDPFLADALEGFAVEGVNVTADIEELKARLQRRTEEKKVIPLSPGRKGFYYFRVAAAIIVLAGAGWFVYEYAFNKKPGEIANLETQHKSADTTVTNIPPGAAAPTNNGYFTDSAPRRKETTATKTITQTGRGLFETKKDTVVAPIARKNELANANAYDFKTDKKEAVKEITKADDIKAPEKDAIGEKAPVVEAKGIARSRETMPVPRGVADNYYSQPSNNFRGSVRSNTNEPVPFANVSNISNNTNTYTDAKGYFQLNSSDSVLRVEVASVGYERNNALLKNNVSNEIVLNPSKNQLSEVVVTAYKKAEDDELNDIKFDAEPVDGWDKYNLYLQNNIKVPTGFKSSSASLVELSFDVNKKGRPVNIKLETSLNKDCNHEAIRLLKEGPNWKKGSGKVKIYFK